MIKNLFPLLVLVILAPSQNAFASESYIESGLANQAARMVYGNSAGVGTSSCTLCHNTDSGGMTSDPDLNSTFGAAFSTIGLGTANMTVEELAESFELIEDRDSDNDGLLNGEELEICSDPSDPNVTTSQCTSNGSGGDGGGCGLVGTSGGGPFGGIGLLLLLLSFIFPLLIQLQLKKRLILT